MDAAVEIVDNLHAAARLAGNSGAAAVAMFGADVRDRAAHKKYAGYLCVALRRLQSDRRPSWAAATRRLVSVNRFAVVGLELGSGGVSAIARGLPRLTELEIAGTTLGSVGLEGLTDSLHRPESMIALGLAHTSVGAVSIMAMAAKLTRLRRLDLSSNMLGDHGAIVAAQGLDVLTELEELDLRGNEISAAAQVQIRTTLSHVSNLIFDDT